MQLTFNSASIFLVEEGCFFCIIIVINIVIIITFWGGIRFKRLNDIFSNQQACLINCIHKTLTIE